MISFTVPIRTYSEANRREHWAAKARRVKQQRTAVALFWPKLADKLKPVIFGLTITLVRIAPRKLDDDNLVRSLKAVRDQVAKQLEINDGSDWPRWLYSQSQSKRRQYAVEVAIRSWEQPDGHP